MVQDCLILCLCLINFQLVLSNRTIGFKGLGGGSIFTINCKVGDTLIVSRAATYEYPSQGIIVNGATQIFSYQPGYAHIYVFRATSSKVTFNNATVGNIAVAKLV